MGLVYGYHDDGRHEYECGFQSECDGDSPRLVDGIKVHVPDMDKVSIDFGATYEHRYGDKMNETILGLRCKYCAFEGSFLLKPWMINFD